MHPVTPSALFFPIFSRAREKIGPPEATSSCKSATTSQSAFGCQLPCKGSLWVFRIDIGGEIWYSIEKSKELGYECFDLQCGQYVFEVSAVPDAGGAGRGVRRGGARRDGRGAVLREDAGKRRARRRGGRLPHAPRGHRTDAAAAAADRAARPAGAGLRRVQGRAGAGRERRAAADGRRARADGGLQLHRPRAQPAVPRCHPPVPRASAKYAAHRRV